MKKITKAQFDDFKEAGQIHPDIDYDDLIRAMNDAEMFVYDKERGLSIGLSKSFIAARENTLKKYNAISHLEIFDSAVEVIEDFKKKITHTDPTNEECDELAKACIDFLAIQNILENKIHIQ